MEPDSEVIATRSLRSGASAAEEKLGIVDNPIKQTIEITLNLDNMIASQSRLSLSSGSLSTPASSRRGRPDRATLTPYLIVHRSVKFDAESVKQFVSAIEHCRADIEGMTHAAIVFHRAVKRLIALTQKYIVIAELETGHPRVGKPADMFQTEDVTVEFPRLIQIIDRNRPMDHRIEVQFLHTAAPFELHLPHSLGAVHRRKSKKEKG
ncbi:MAG: hypothetical protein ACM3SP_11945 [Chloroflexota bacterium]